MDRGCEARRPVVASPTRRQLPQVVGRILLVSLQAEGRCLAAGAAFVKPQVRQGLLPSILAALVSARKQTRAALKAEASSAQRAVLDSRQKALKLCANALYGFTGQAQSSSQLAVVCPVHVLPRKHCTVGLIMILATQSRPYDAC